MHVRDCMTPTPITISVTETLQGAMELMQMKHIRHLPVVDAQHRVLGLVTDRDLRRVAPSPLFARDGAKNESDMEQTTVERIMVRSPATTTPSAALKDVLRVFTEKKYGALPVLDGQRLVGIVTPIDLMRCWLKSLP